MKSKNYSVHIAVASALFVLGNAVILTPTLNITNLFLIPLLLLFALAVSYFLKNRNGVIVLGVALYGAWTTIFDYINFLKDEQMPSANKILLLSVLLGVVAIFVFAPKSAIYKYSLLVFVVVVAIMLLCFVSGIGNFDYKIAAENFFDFSFSVKTLLRFFVPVIVLPLAYQDKTKYKNPMFLGTMTGVGLLTVASIQAFLTIGNDTSVTFPYLSAVNVISVGSIFTRLNGFVWFLFFATSLVKIVICVKVILDFKITNIYKQKVP